MHPKDGKNNILNELFGQKKSKLKKNGNHINRKKEKRHGDFFPKVIIDATEKIHRSQTGQKTVEKLVHQKIIGIVKTSFGI